MNIYKCSNSEYAPFGVRGGSNPGEQNDGGRCESLCTPSCDCDCASCCAEIPGSCLPGMIAVLTAILNVVAHMSVAGFQIKAEITTEDGVIHTITFGVLTAPVTICDTTLITPTEAISICDISKIHILSGTLPDPTFENRLLQALSKLSAKCRTGCKGSCCCCRGGNGDMRCAEEIQNYLCENHADIAAVSYNGGLETVQSLTVPTKIEYTNVVGSAYLSPSTTSVVGTAGIRTTPTTVVEAIVPAPGNVVSSVQAATETVVTHVDGVPINACAPITSVPTTVVTNVSTIPIPNLNYGLSTTPATVIDSIVPRYMTVVTGFQPPSQMSGVLSGFTGFSVATPVTVSIPVMTGWNPGPLQVTINGVNYPVTAGGTPVMVQSYVTAYTLPNGTNILNNIAGRPTLSTVSQQGEAIPGSAVRTVDFGTTDVTQDVNFGTVSGSLVSNVRTGTVGSVSAPDTVSVLRDVDVTTDPINALGPVGTRPISSLVSTTPTEVVGSASINTTPATVLTSVGLTATPRQVVESIDTTTVSIQAPVKEDIDGTVNAVGCGILSVNNTNGDVSVYSVCDINSATTH